jgi:hypothetical protein
MVRTPVVGAALCIVCDRFARVCCNDDPSARQGAAAAASLQPASSPVRGCTAVARPQCVAFLAASTIA